MVVRLVSIVLALVIGASCSKSPAAPSTAVPVTAQPAAFEGVWTIKYTVGKCTGYRHCIDFIGDSRTIYLHVARVGDAYDGVVQLDDAVLLSSHVSVSGVVGSDGTLTLTGKKDTIATNDYDLDIDAITLPASSASQPQAGSVRFTVRGASNPFFYGQATTEGPITVAQRTGELENWSSFSGKWTGNIAIETCEATGWTHCYPLWENEKYGVTLTLSPGGQGVTGILDIGPDIPVTGSTSGEGTRLTGTVTTQSSGSTTTYVVETSSLAVDRVGRLTGSVTLTAQWNWNDGRVSLVKYPPLPLYFAARSLR
jgi:hypothetical protein